MLLGTVGYSRDYIQAKLLMLQQDAAKDYVVASGESHSVREFLDLAFRHVGLDYQDYLVIEMVDCDLEFYSQCVGFSGCKTVG